MAKALGPRCGVGGSIQGRVTGIEIEITKIARAMSRLDPTRVAFQKRQEELAAEKRHLTEYREKLVEHEANCERCAGLTLD